MLGISVCTSNLCCERSSPPPLVYTCTRIDLSLARFLPLFLPSSLPLFRVACPWRVQSGKASFGALLPNLSDLTTLTVRRKYARSVRLEDVVKIKGISECLGKGVSGTVWKVRDKSVDETLALKEMAMDATDEAKNQVPCVREAWGACV